jgi:steroid 5-alpha reductase family enzyme
VIGAGHEFRQPELEDPRYKDMLGSWQELPALAAPLLMTFILTRGTGASMTDRRMKASRPGYAGYVERTSGFIPLPPKRRPRAAASVRPGRG